MQFRFRQVGDAVLSVPHEGNSNFIETNLFFCNKNNVCNEKITLPEKRDAEDFRPLPDEDESADGNGNFSVF